MSIMRWCIYIEIERNQKQYSSEKLMSKVNEINESKIIDNEIKGNYMFLVLFIVFPYLNLLPQFSMTKTLKNDQAKNALNENQNQKSKINYI